MAGTKEKETLNITCHGAVLDQVDKFEYLGSTSLKTYRPIID